MTFEEEEALLKDIYGATNPFDMYEADPKRYASKPTLSALLKRHAPPPPAKFHVGQVVAWKPKAHMPVYAKHIEVVNLFPGALWGYKLRGVPVFIPENLLRALTESEAK